ncbi:MAG: hypothetical protein M1834_009617 [Cirrosporium novae-zelandiae]|nr:MAG: hypothetical protein M1834_009617 [Cirrosporium novae-zelandiae]
MKSLAETCEDWKLLFSHGSQLSDLKKAIKCSQDGVGSRSACWKAFLLFEDLEQSTWATKLSGSRSAYSSLREHFLKRIQDPNEFDSIFDPLTDDAESPWNSIRQDENLRTEIIQDVERCYQENYFFREPSTQTMLLNILFVYTKLNEDVGYRQGMHELLAPLLWVIERDAIQKSDIESVHVEEQNISLIQDLFNADFIEHDAFTLFSLIMRCAKPFYEHSSNSEENIGGERRRNQGDTAIVARSKKIHEDLLAKVDPELADRLTQLDVLPQVFIIRWVRLLFSREFPFDDVLSLWDALFAEDPELKTVDLICVVMLLRIRWKLLRADYSSALALLLRYPTEIEQGPSILVYDAIYLGENLNTEGGAALILKYSGKAPKRPRPESIPGSFPKMHIRLPVRPQRSKTPASASKESLEDPLRSIRNPESVFHGVLDSFQKRTEAWNVRKVVQDAAGEVRKSIQTQVSPRRHASRSSRSESRSAPVRPTRSRASSKILQERDRLLAEKLENAVEELQAREKAASQNGSREDEKDINEQFDTAITKIKSVISQLRDFGPPTVLKHVKQDAVADAQSSMPTTLTAAPTSQPQPRLVPSSSDSAPITPSIVETPFSKLPPQSAPLSPRASLATSNFSWMLGEERPSLSFVSSRPDDDSSHQEIPDNQLFADNSGEVMLPPPSVFEEGEEGPIFTLNTLKRMR